MKIAIVGSRNYSNMAAVCDFVRALSRDTEIVSGGARGVDSAAVGIAQQLQMPTKVFPADWNTYGKSAGFRRNADIVNYADKVVAFWDGKSRGTEHTIRLAKAADKLSEVIREPKGIYADK